MTELDYSHIDTPEWQEHAKRSREWFDNPLKVKARRAAKNEIKKRVGSIVEPLGFSSVARGTGWELDKRLVIRGIYVQPSRSGDRCYFNLSKKSKYRGMEIFGAKRQVKRLGKFYASGYDRVGEPGSLYYYDVERYPHYVDEAMDVIARQAIPWLLQ